MLLIKILTYIQEPPTVKEQGSVNLIHFQQAAYMNRADSRRDPAWRWPCFFTLIQWETIRHLYTIWKKIKRLQQSYEILFLVFKDDLNYVYVMHLAFRMKPVCIKTCTDKKETKCKFLVDITTQIFIHLSQILGGNHIHVLAQYPQRHIYLHIQYNRNKYFLFLLLSSTPYIQYIRVTINLSINFPMRPKIISK